jgi:hypothetical protein
MKLTMMPGLPQFKTVRTVRHESRWLEPTMQARDVVRRRDEGVSGGDELSIGPPELADRVSGSIYAELDGALLKRHVQRPLAHSDEEVREVGLDFEHVRACLNGED